MHRKPTESGAPPAPAWRPLAALALASAVIGGCGPDDPKAGLFGADSPAKRCVVCHSLEKDGPFRVAPNLWGIVGAPKARDRAWYSYSHGLLESGGSWTREELDRFLANPAAYAPGSRMNIRVTDAAERERIIDFLAQLED